MASSSSSSPAVNSGDLVDLVSSSASATVYPSDDAILAVLQARFRADLPYSRLNSSHLVVVNPYKALANTNDVSAQEYEERCYKDTSLPLTGSSQPLPPHLYDLAAKVYLLMRRRTESQAVVFRGITGSGKSFSRDLLINQILRLSTHSKRELKLAEQVRALAPVLDAFGNAKTLLNPNASRHGRYFELHFNERGRLSGAKVLTYGLDKSRLNRLSHEERTYHIFYQLLAGATPAERDAYNLEDPSDYALLASSGCYRLPSGPFSDDSIAMEDLRVALRTLGFKAKHISAIFSLIVAILLLGNLQFGDGDYKDASAYVANVLVLDHAARLLGVPSEDLAQTLTNKTSYVRKELYTVLMNAQQSAAQRDHFVRDLYAILFAFVVETANHRVAPSASDPPPHTQVVLLDQPGFQSRGPASTASMMFNAPLIHAYGQNGFDEFCINFQDEMVHSYVVRNIFEDSVGYNGHLVGDGISLPAITVMDNSACIELIRGAQLNERAHKKPAGMLGVMNKACSSFKSGKSGDKRDEDLLQEIVSKCGGHASFVASTGADANTFGINHYAGPCNYETTDFVEKDTDMLDSAFVTLLRSSSDSFVSKLFSGPSLAAEKHSKDENAIVQAQVSSRPLRHPTPVPASGSSSPTAEEHPHLDPTKVYPVTTQLNFNLSEIISTLDRTRLWTVSCIRPNDSGSSNSFDKRRVKAQIRSLLLPDIVARRKTEYVADYDQLAFCDRYVPTMRGSEEERIRQCASSNGWKEGSDYVLGHRMIWLSYGAWKSVEDVLRASEKDRKESGEGVEDSESAYPEDTTEYDHQDPPTPRREEYGDSADDLLLARTGSHGTQYRAPNTATGYAAVGYSDVNIAPQYEGDGQWHDYGSDKKGLTDEMPSTPAVATKELVPKEVALDTPPVTTARKWWLRVCWLMTWWVPTFMLTYIGRMKRPDVRLAWREKFTIFLLIFLLNCFIIFYIVEFGRLLCPDSDKAWNVDEVGEHTGDNDYWVAIQGNVYDITDFVKGQHSDISGEDSNDSDTLEELAGQDLTNYFPPPLVLACPDLVSDDTLTLSYANFTATVTTAVHTSGSLATDSSSKLADSDWYTATFQPVIKKYIKGPLVYTKSTIESQATSSDDDSSSTDTKTWAIYNDHLYDLTDYFYTIDQNSATTSYEFLDSSITDVFQQQPGKDITKTLNSVMESMDATTVAQNLACLNNKFYIGEVDFRKSARCQVQNYILLAASIILCASMVVKFLAALQLGGKRNPEMLDKFVLCQVPCYTEGEDSLRRTIDSLANLNYDDKRKLIFIICDGNIIGSGNDRTTPRIVLDVLGVDPKLDPEPLLFKSIGEGSKQLNYGKVYSGLYEFEGHVVPYMVVVKVGKPSERQKPGNRGKRDSQILLMSYLNKVHFDSPMAPLELEIYHQMRNVIGIDPAFYEYIFTVDADTTVTPDSVNRLVASVADDSSIIGICGETKLENPEGSWWTMIQVYEYYISHHLSKAFESLFGSVTCLPGCFSMYRIRTADKGRPVIISSRIIDEYSENLVDTLHKKNLFSLGEDRYLTTLMMKHFPTFKTKFTPDAVAHTVAPESWRVLLSQRRRWINSTVHNLCELVFLPELFGFCCFSMRFFVFIDLLGTLILPATVVYLLYLIIIVAIGGAAVPLISIIMIAAVYGLQALVFIIKREFMLVGWMVVYLLSYPVWSFMLPVYSFWCMDEFGWGSTRLIVGEGKDKKVIVNEDDVFHESMIPLKKFSDYEAETWEGSHQGDMYSKPGSHIPPHSRAQSRAQSPYGSQAGDFYRDTNVMDSKKDLRSHPSQGSMSQYGGHQQPPMSQYGAMPQLPFMPFGTGYAGSAAGSDYGGHMQMGMPYQQTGSVYGMMPPGGPRNTMMSFNQNPFSGGMAPGMGSGQSIAGGAPPSMGGGMMQPRMSTFSLATSVNPFAGPSNSTNPTDEELTQALRNYLSTQDLMTVTKKTAREAIMARFPKADLAPRKQFLNDSIDAILREA